MDNNRVIFTLERLVDARRLICHLGQVSVTLNFLSTVRPYSGDDESGGAVTRLCRLVLFYWIFSSELLKGSPLFTHFASILSIIGVNE
jgi:hypothetical protein